MPDTLLHWHCRGKTYSVKRLTRDRAFLIVTSENGTSWRSRRPLTFATVAAWGKMSIDERCEQAERELGPAVDPPPN